MDPVGTLLIVEDTASLAETLRQALAPRAHQVRVANTLRAAREAIAASPPDAVLLDVNLPDGSALELMEDLRALTPWPHVIAMSGSASPEEAFRLAQAGVRAFVPKPVQLDRLEEVWNQTLQHPPSLLPLVRASVGKVPLRDLEEQVREAMVDEALARAQGSRRGAAKMLDVSRQVLQHILKRRS